MRSFLALSPIRAKACQIESAQNFATVFFTALGPERTESLVVMGAGRKFGGWIDVQVDALIPVGTVEGSSEVVAFRHTTSA